MFFSFFLNISLFDSSLFTSMGEGLYLYTNSPIFTLIYYVMK